MPLFEAPHPRACPESTNFGTGSTSPARWARGNLHGDMERSAYRPVLVSPKAANLLIFLPRLETRLESRLETRPDTAPSGLPESVYARLQTHFGDTLRILKIDDASHPEVIASFGVSQRPTFVLVRQGAEIWRQEGLTDFDQFLRSLQDKVNTLPTEPATAA